MGMNLLKKGYNLVVYDVYPEAMEPFKSLGATAVTTPRQVAQQVQKIITMLPSRLVVSILCPELILQYI